MSFRYFTWAALPFLLLAALLLLTTSRCEGPSHPTDMALKKRLQERESEFQQLIDMYHQDMNELRLISYVEVLPAVVPDSKAPASKQSLTQHKWDEYRKLFRTLQLQSISRSVDNKGVNLNVSNVGLAVGGSAKGYTYSREDLSPLVNSLDETRNLPRTRPVYNKIKDNWYIYYW